MDHLKMCRLDFPVQQYASNQATKSRSGLKMDSLDLDVAQGEWNLIKSLRLTPRVPTL